MKTKISFLVILFVLSCSLVFAQKEVLSYPFVFEKGLFVAPDNDAYFLTDKSMDNVAFVLHDYKKADYILTDNNMKVISSFTVPISKSLFSEYKEDYVGGTASILSNTYNFIYKVTETKGVMLFTSTKEYYRIEVVNFKDKTVTQKEFVQIPKEEKMINSFCDYGEYYSVTANDRTSEIVIRTLTQNGEIVIKTIPIKIPAGKKKNRDKLSEYFKGTHLVKDNEEIELETATQSSKLFSTKDKITFLINDEAYPTHIITIDKNNYDLKESFIEHDKQFIGEEKEKVFVNSYQFDKKIFSLILNKKSIVIAEYDLKGILLGKQEINEENLDKILAQLPVYNERKGTKIKEEEVEDFKKLVKALTKGTEGLVVAKNKTGQYLVTVGTYDPIMIPSGGGGSSHTVFQSSPGGNTAMGSVQMGSVYLNTYSTPGVSSYTKGGANYYKTTSFKLLLDPITFKTIKGRPPLSVADQIKDYMDGRNEKVRKQFAVGDRQYFGYYDKNSKSYVIENISIRK